MPELGKKYKYIRYDEDKLDVVDAEGIMIAMYLDSTNRKLYNMREEHEPDAQCNKYTHYNIDAVCLEADEDFKEVYSLYLGNIKSISADAEKKQKEVVDDTNAKIDIMHLDILGEPIEVEE